ncbi:store-operated calcium entry-associated regulatory factor isoform X1 [Oreochromis niloticus]|uniref:store-operated calcium entry-associated regulatory factor isoform X1 n=1 Tax=Oreochromis niloticus TaxID=8128 RepID=UPI0006743DA7|nr:store-operated calcium entry-associated regulatory factor isoform X1 [Oreochromis niloticus]
MNVFFSGVLLLLCARHTDSWDDGSVLLRDIQALTLYRNRYTTARRSSPIPQLKCVGGSAGCHAFVPEVVQCVNKGWNGFDVQWECRTDMDNTYRFGHIEVSCEGYSHPADAYILKGSCGLEYTLELTEEGQRRAHSSRGSRGGFKDLWGFASSFFSGSSEYGQQHDRQSSYPAGTQDSGGLLVVAVLLLLAYGFHKLFLSGNNTGGQDDGPATHSGHNYHGSMGGPPPPGFKPDYTDYPGANPSYGFHSDYTHRHQYPGGRAASGTGGGFWTGMGTGGVLGYLFGRQRSQPYNSNYPTHTNRPAREPPSSGTRVTSGFGGTKRR